jgi:serine/threonine protein kinase
VVVSERGHRIGRYIVVDTIGAGAMGTVYAAYDPELARTVALKVVKPHAERRLGLRMRLLREAQAMARVVHPNVVPIFDVGEHGDRLYLAMERIDGTSLRRWKGDTSVDAVLDVLVQAGQGLAAAHREGLVHRDFKPENVLVAADGRAWVTDFGLARPHVEQTAMPGLLGVEVTHDGDRIGTPAYMAPEQRRGDPADPRSDVYAFCVVLHEALHGARPDEPASALRSVPRWLSRIIARGLADDPALRFASMDTLLAELEHHRGRRRAWLRRAFAGVAMLGAVSFALATIADAREGPQPCDDADRLPDELPAIANARLARAIDAHVATWRSTRREVCEATWVRGDQSPELLDARMLCLETAWTRMRHTIELAHANVERSPALLEGLPPADRCRTAEDMPPTASRDVWLGARDVLARADTLRLAGREDEALALLQPIVPRVRGLGRGPLLAETLIVLAQLDHSMRASLLDEALRIARATHQPRLEAEVWIALAQTPAEAQFCARMAAAAIEAAGGDPWLQSRVALP